MLVALAVITTTVVGTMVGVEFAVAVFVNPILLRLPAGSSLESRADGARVLGRVMPFWYVGSLILTAGLAAATWGAPAAGAAIAAAALLVVSVVMSVALLVPINNRSATWTAGDHPAGWREQQQRLGPPALRARGNHHRRVRADARRRGHPLSQGQPKANKRHSMGCQRVADGGQASVPAAAITEHGRLSRPGGRRVRAERRIGMSTLWWVFRILRAQIAE